VEKEEVLKTALRRREREVWMEERRGAREGPKERKQQQVEGKEVEEAGRASPSQAQHPSPSLSLPWPSRASPRSSVVSAWLPPW